MIIVASLYALMLLAFAPISFGPIQLRVADCLLPLAALFGWPVITGVTLGCFVGNAYYWLGTYDVILGPIANLVAAIVIFLLRRQQVTGCVAGSCAIGIIVGGYLWVFFPPPDIFGLSMPIWAAMMVSVTISSFVAIAIIGYALLKALSRPNVIRFFQSLGLTVYIEEK
jgi:uncharacterized membrane protein